MVQYDTVILSVHVLQCFDFFGNVARQPYIKGNIIVRSDI